jgi:hypothetical protein
MRASKSTLKFPFTVAYASVDLISGGVDAIRIICDFLLEPESIIDPAL